KRRAGGTRVRFVGRYPGADAGHPLPQSGDDLVMPAARIPLAQARVQRLEPALAAPVDAAGPVELAEHLERSRANRSLVLGRHPEQAADVVRAPLEARRRAVRRAVGLLEPPDRIVVAAEHLVDPREVGHVVIRRRGVLELALGDDPSTIEVPERDEQIDRRVRGAGPRGRAAYRVERLVDTGASLVGHAVGDASGMEGGHGWELARDGREL